MISPEIWKKKEFQKKTNNKSHKRRITDRIAKLKEYYQKGSYTRARGNILKNGGESELTVEYNWKLMQKHLKEIVERDSVQNMNKRKEIENSRHLLEEEQLELASRKEKLRKVAKERATRVSEAFVQKEEREQKRDEQLFAFLQIAAESMKSNNVLLRKLLEK